MAPKSKRAGTYSHVRNGDGPLAEVPPGYAILDRMDEGVAIIPGLVRLYANRAFAVIHGFGDRNEAMDAIVIPPEGSESWWSNPSAGTPVPRDGYRWQKPSGEYRSLESSYSVIDYDGAPAWLCVIRDVTARVEGQRDLEERERRFRAMFESAPVGILITGKAPGIQDANPALQRILGYTKDELKGTRFGSYWYPGSDQGDPTGHVNKILTGENGSFQADGLLQRSAGSPVWVRGNASAIRDENGEIFQIITMVQDVTEQRRAEEQLQESEERYRVVVENMVDAVVVFDHVAGQRLFVNQQFADLYGYADKVEALAAPLLERVHSNDREFLRARLDSSDARTDTARFRTQRPDGTTRHVSSTRTDITYLGSPAQVVVIRDETDREDSHPMLAASEERYRCLFESAPVGIAIVGENRVISDSNPAIEKMLGRSHEDLRGRDVRGLAASDEPNRFNDNMGRMARGELDVARWDRKLAKPDGESIWTRQTTSAVRDDKGAFLYRIRIIEDITEQKQAFEALQESEGRFRALFEAAPIGSRMTARRTPSTFPPEAS